MKKVCETCVYSDRKNKILCRKNPPGFLMNDWTGTGYWPIVKSDDSCGSWNGGEADEIETPKITSSISCPVCGLSWTAHNGDSWVAVIEAKKSHECIPLSFVNTYPMTV